MKRKIIMHVGPTNSGKTYSALQRFKDPETQSGIYCGPLRLLAHEVYERLNNDGVPCNLRTGEERRESDDVYRWSSTVEMAQTNVEFDVAVIDEIQLIADPQRGWAWTRAFLGVKAREIHLCGEATAVPLIQKLCESAGEEFTVNRYERLSGLTVLNKSINGRLNRIEEGDAVIAFSRRQIFHFKKVIEKETNLKAAVIYGALPPETRSEQARLFNDPTSDYKVLVASDAVGMGLNL
jgi:ATP-dependent RNA helicase SUPV3L1/SUV3